MSEIAPKPGSRYSPFGKFHTAMVPLALIGYAGLAGGPPPRSLSDGAKLLFGVLSYCGGKSGKFPKQTTLATMMGVSIDTLKRYVQELVAHGLVAVKRHGPGKSGSYEFTWVEFLSKGLRKVSDLPPQEDHADVANLQPQEAAEVANLRSKGGNPATIEVAILPPAFKEEEVFLRGNEEDPSSSSPDVGKSEGPEQQLTTTKTASFPSNGKPKTPECWWTPDDERKAAELLLESRGEWNTLKPDLGAILAILSNMESIEDFELWLSASVEYFRTAKTWGRYVSHAKLWPHQRAHAQVHLDRAASVGNRQIARCRHGIQPSLCMECDEPIRPIQHETPEQLTALKQPDPGPKCGQCSDHGVIGELEKARCCDQCDAGNTEKAKQVVEQQHWAARATGRLRRVPA